MNRTSVIIGLLMLLTSMSGCKDTRSNREILEDIYKDYTLAQYMRENLWKGLGDSDIIYSPNLVLYNELDIQGKSFKEIEKKYGTPLKIYPDTLYHGISVRNGWPSAIYPIAYQRDSVPILFSYWYFENDISMTIYFETQGDNTKAIYGHQIKEQN